MSADAVKKDLPPIVFELIGRVTSDWAGLEYLINECIWALALVPRPLGACITAQIFNTDGRIRALLALLKLRQADQRIIDAVNVFSEEMRGPSERRNRIVHDVWSAHEDTGAIFKMEITARNKLKFELQEIDIETIKADVKTVFDCVKKFLGIRNLIFSSLPSLPSIPLEVIHTTLGMHDHPL